MQGARLSSGCRKKGVPLPADQVAAVASGEAVLQPAESPEVLVHAGCLHLPAGGVAALYWQRDRMQPLSGRAGVMRAFWLNLHP